MTSFLKWQIAIRYQSSCHRFLPVCNSPPIELHHTVRGVYSDWMQRTKRDIRYSTHEKTRHSDSQSKRFRVKILVHLRNNSGTIAIALHQWLKALKLSRLVSVLECIQIWSHSWNVKYWSVVWRTCTGIFDRTASKYSPSFVFIFETKRLSALIFEQYYLVWFTQTKMRSHKTTQSLSK